MRITVSQGLDAVIDAAAALADAAFAFLTRSWFAATEMSGIVTLAAESPDGIALIALPVARAGRFLKSVPGCYWPFRSFPVARQALPEHMGALLRDRAARRTLGYAWRIGPVLSDDPALGLLRASARASGWIVAERHIATGFRLDLCNLAAQGGWPRNSTLRKNRFHEKHLATHGALEWTFASGAAWTSALFDDLAAIEARSWHAGSSDPKFLPGPHRCFWQNLAADPAQAARMNVALLKIDGRPAAFSFDIDSGSMRYAIANSYDPEFARHSPGKCLQYRNLADAQRRGIGMVDWGAGDAGYKQMLGAVPSVEIVDCLMLRAGWRTPLSVLIRMAWQRSGRKTPGRKNHGGPA